MSLNNNQEDNNQFFGDEFSEEQQNFDNDPAVVAATEAISSKSKGGWIVLLVGIIGTGAYLGYRYYLVPHGTTLASIEAALLPESHASGNPSVPSLEKHAEAKIPQPQASDAHVPDTTVSEVKVSKAPAPANTPVAETAKSTETDKAARQANKNAQFEHLRASLFDTNGETTKPTEAVPPPTPS